MGLSYEQFLVAAPLGPVVAALSGVRRGYAIPAGGRTTAVILDEHVHDYKLDSIASRLSRDVESEVCVATVVDSGVLWLRVVRDGFVVHEYCSQPEHTGPEHGGTAPSGADPAWFLRFGTADATADRAAHALSGQVTDPSDPRAGKRHIYAERVYGEVLGALGLRPDIAFLPYAELDAMAREAVEPEPSYEGLPETYIAIQRRNRAQRAARRADFTSAYPLGDAVPIPPPTPIESTIT